MGNKTNISIDPESGEVLDITTSKEKKKQKEQPTNNQSNVSLKLKLVVVEDTVFEIEAVGESGSEVAGLVDFGFEKITAFGEDKRKIILPKKEKTVISYVG